MSMVTRCPNCTTSFKITSQLLKMRQGMVRCGRCSKVFNAFDTLSTVHDALPETPMIKPEAPQIPPGLPVVREEPVQAAVPEIPAEPLPPEPLPEPFEAPAEEFFAGEKPSKFGWAWSLGSMLLMVSLLAQTAYYYRMEISISMPGSKPFLQVYCRLLECTIPLARKAELIGIESSGLQAETGRAGVIDLNASIRNSASFAQEYPLLELTLTDAQDAPLARKVFRPSDYLRKDASTDDGIAPNGAVNVSLSLDTGSLLPNGYRLYLFYP